MAWRRFASAFPPRRPAAGPGLRRRPPRAASRRIELGKQPPVLKVGNLEARRDFTDVRDVVRAYLLAAEKGKSGEVYNVGSGTATRLREVVALLLKMTRTRISLEVDPARKHTVEAAIYVCDARRFQRLTGWRPKIGLERMLRDTLDDWRRQERSAA